MPQSPSPSLASCPHCGGSRVDQWRSGLEGLTIRCRDCNYRFCYSSMGTDADAIAAWNRRAAPALEALGQAEPALGYATRLAEAMWSKHYRDDAPNWKALPDLMGVLTQIDNIAAGLIRPRNAAALQQQEAGSLSDEQIDAIVGGMYVPIGFTGGWHPSQYTNWCREFARAVLAARAPSPTPQDAAGVPPTDGEGIAPTAPDGGTP